MAKIRVRVTPAPRRRRGALTGDGSIAIYDPLEVDRIIEALTDGAFSGTVDFLYGKLTEEFWQFEMPTERDSTARRIGGRRSGLHALADLMDLRAAELPASQMYEVAGAQAFAAAAAVARSLADQEEASALELERLRGALYRLIIERERRHIYNRIENEAGARERASLSARARQAKVEARDSAIWKAYEQACAEGKSGRMALTAAADATRECYAPKEATAEELQKLDTPEKRRGLHLERLKARGKSWRDICRKVIEKAQRPAKRA